VVFAVLNCALPHVLSAVLAAYYQPSMQQYQLMRSFSLLLLGMFLSALATLNFSLSFLIGLLASPLTFMETSPAGSPRRVVSTVALNLVAPTAVVVAGSLLWAVDLGQVLRMAAFGWDVWGMYTAVVAWCVWWPAWLVSSVIVLGRPSSKAKTA